MTSDTEEGFDHDALEVDSDDIADPMEFKSVGVPTEPDGSPQPDRDDITGLSQAVEECFNVSKEDFSLLFPALVPTFSLKKKTWLWILSDQLQDVAWNMAAFKYLVQALVKGHKTNSTVFDDVVAGKGQGLVFLLHGYVSGLYIRQTSANEVIESLDWARP